METIKSQPFFAGGVQFECTNCGQCCTGAPGIVRVNEEDMDRIAAFLKITPTEFREKYVRKIVDGWSLKERPNGDCAFFEDGCKIYPVRPVQCRTYPFWFENMRSESAWQQTIDECPGIGQGRRFTEEEILANIQADMDQSP